MTFDALVNFRDLGGHPVAFGGRTRSGWAFRSDGVQRASDADLDRLRSLGVRRVIDLRTDHERTTDGRADGRHPDIDVVAIPFLDATVPHNAGEGDLLGIYLHVVRERQAAVLAAVRSMLDSPGAVVFHCTAGKDRTGVLAALLLGAIGVEDQHIVEDFARSADAMALLVRWYESNSADASLVRRPDSPLRERMMRADPDDMRLVLHYVRHRHGAPDRYLLDAGLSEVELALLRSRLHDPTPCVL